MSQQRAELIESGSHTPGIDPADFRLPPATALRYERPDDRLRPLLPSYAVFDSDAKLWKGQVNWKLPGSTQLWIVLAEPITARVRNKRYPKLGATVIYGSTRAATSLITNGGVSVMADIGPAGWARWFDVSADKFCDQITPLDQLWPAEQVQELARAIATCGSALDLKARLDAFFLDRLPRPNADETKIAEVARLMAMAEEQESGELAASVGLSEQQLRRLTLRYFGFPPKLLMRRTRFLRALTSLLMSDAPDFSQTPDGYHSVPHFHRDAVAFLGTTARRFAAMPVDYLSATLRARTAVIGAPTPLLDLPEG